MKYTFTFLFFACILILNSYGQNQKSFNTLTFFYVDNSEGYTSDELNASLSHETAEELKKKLNGVTSKPDNYFFMIASNGTDVKQANSASAVLDSDWLNKYLTRTSKEADYNVERQTIRDNFTAYPLRIKKEVDVYLFLSSYALNQTLKRLDEIPVPLFFPKELPLYLNNPALTVNIRLFASRATIEKLGIDHIKKYFNFCTSELNITQTDLEIIPL